MSAGLALLAILASLATGYWLFQSYGSGGANAAYDVIGLVSSIFWILAGIFAILGGFVLLGIFLLVVWSYIGLSKGKETKARFRRRIAG